MKKDSNINGKRVASPSVTFDKHGDKEKNASFGYFVELIAHPHLLVCAASEW